MTHYHYQFNGNPVQHYSWEELIEDWFFLLLIKFLKKENLYAKACEIYFTPLKEGKHTCINEAYSNNYMATKMMFGTLSCTFMDWSDENFFANPDELNRYEIKWSQFIYHHKHIFPKEITRCYKDFDKWFVGQYRCLYCPYYKDDDFVESILKKVNGNG